jgi:hypothetical protein
MFESIPFGRLALERWATTGNADAPSKNAIRNILTRDCGMLVMVSM